MSTVHDVACRLCAYLIIEKQLKGAVSHLIACHLRVSQRALSNAPRAGKGRRQDGKDREMRGANQLTRIGVNQEPAGAIEAMSHCFGRQVHNSVVRPRCCLGAWANACN